jgi:hypothetical protein
MGSNHRLMMKLESRVLWVWIDFVQMKVVQ